MKSCSFFPSFHLSVSYIRVSPKGGFFAAKSGCVLYADATYTRVYTVVIKAISCAVASKVRRFRILPMPRK